MNLKTRQNTFNAATGWLFFLILTFWLSIRSKPEIIHLNTKTIPQNISISSQLSTLPDRLCFLWTSTRDNMLRKSTFAINLRYGLQFQIKKKSLHVVLLILLAGDIATNPGPLSKGQRFLSFNAQSLRSVNKREDGTFTSNLRSFQDLVYAENLDVISVTETWLNDSVNDDEILPSDYNIIRKDRPSNKRGGGVLLALRKGIECNRVTSAIWSDRLEIVAVELETRGPKKCLMCVCYRPPNCDLVEWLSLFESFLQVAENYEKIIITGDFNFPELNWNSDATSSQTVSGSSVEFRDLIYDFFLEQVNPYPTRLNNILDLILTNIPESVTDMSCISPKSMDVFSDHNLLFFEFNVFVKLSSCDTRTVLDYRSADWESLFKTLSSIDLSPSIVSDEIDSNNPDKFSLNFNLNSNPGDIDKDWQRWCDRFMDAVHRHIPTKVMKKRKSPPWLDNEIRHLLNKKETARRKAKKSSRINLWENFRDLRRSCKSLLSRKRKEFFQSLPSLMKSNTKRFWSLFKSVSNTSSVPSKMTWKRDEGTITAENPQDVANLLNNFFYSMFNPPLSQEDYNDHPVSTTASCDCISDIYISPDDVRRILLSLDDNKATGPDRIPAKLLRCCAPYISSSLSDVFNKSLSTGRVPAEWKVSNIIPIPKGGQKNEVSNYRPISLLPIVSKVFERCIYDQLINHVSCQLYNLQFGFLRGKSTTSQLLQVLHEIGESLDKRVQTDILYLDFAKAFDRVDHQLLLKKLRNFGVCGNLFNWLQNYLTDRFQKVTVLGKTSRPIPVLSGVPQGSILGPLLFLMYVNDLPEKTTASSVALFADDTKCYRTIGTTEDAKHLQCDLDGINQWCRMWRMNLNQSKCGVLTVTRNLNPVQSCYHLTNDDLTNTSVISKRAVQKDLGVLITPDLKWNHQVSAVCAKANRMLGFVRRSSIDMHDPRVRCTLYKTLVRSHFAYSSQVWSPQSVSSILDIEKVQRRATRFILSLPFRSETCYKDRLLMTGLLPLCYWHEYLDLVYFFKAMKRNDQYITIKSSNRVTRRDSNNSIAINVPRVNTLTYQNSFYNRTPRIFNSLPSHTREADVSIGQFKSYLLNYYRTMTEQIYDIDVPQTFKTVCIKCHSCRPLPSLVDKMCCK